MAKVCGFIILRLPKENFCEGYFDVIKIDELYYQGINRMAWNDIEEDEVGPIEVPIYYKTLLSQLEFPRCGPRLLTKEIYVAKELLKYSNRNKQLNEIVAIYSKQLELDYGDFEVDMEIEWLGEDIRYFTGSMIAEGIFTKPELFKKYKRHLNKYGLFDIDSKITDSYIDFYNKINKAGANLEVFTEEKNKLQKIWIGRLK